MLKNLKKNSSKDIQKKLYRQLLASISRTINLCGELHDMDTDIRTVDDVGGDHRYSAGGLVGPAPDLLPFQQVGDCSQKSPGSKRLF